VQMGRRYIFVIIMPRTSGSTHLPSRSAVNRCRLFLYIPSTFRAITTQHIVSYTRRRFVDLLAPRTLLVIASFIVGRSRKKGRHFSFVLSEL
jgi:hypothetical protein